MRELKFRAWDKETNDWYDDKDQHLVIGMDGEITNCWNGELMETYTDRVVLLPFIGRKDENDTEIYQKYIVSVIEQGHAFGYYYEHEFVGVVEYDEEMCCYYLELLNVQIHDDIPSEIDGLPVFREDQDEMTRYHFGPYISSEDIRILGNVFENPDLLEVQP